MERETLMPKMPQPSTHDNGWTDWILPQRHYRLGCCDCGLVHDIEFRVVIVKRLKNGTYRTIKVNPVDCRVEFRARRNNRSTGQMRRGKKHGPKQ